METLRSFLPGSVSGGSLQDTLKLVVIGGTVETARRLSVSAWNGFVDSFFLTATFNQGDITFDWIMHWLSKQPAWGRSREFEITTRAISRNGLSQATTGDVEEDEIEEEDDDMGRRKRKISFLPSMDTAHSIYYRGHVLRITRTKNHEDHGHYSSLKISVVARNNDILKKLVLEAKREYEKDAEHRVHIYMADTTYACWRWNGARRKRPLSSIVLDASVKDMLVRDARDFMRSEDWYAERGIPFRRGYLLHGVPGSGKTSLIHALAGELNLDIYVVSLSSERMNENMLATLLGSIPARCILLLEDLDAAFTKSVSRDTLATSAPPGTSKTASDMPDVSSTLSLSGLLNSLDGVTAAEGRLLFATTNHVERLDPALCRPGRMDVWVNFTYARRFQAEEIFRNFFPSRSKEVASIDPRGEEKATLTGGNKTLPEFKHKAPLHASQLLIESEIAELAKRFADAIPEDEMSVASLQGYLLRNKTRPQECVEEVAAWVQQEREAQEELKKEKDRETREKQERQGRESTEKARLNQQRKKAHKVHLDASDATFPLPLAPPGGTLVPARSAPPVNNERSPDSADNENGDSSSSASDTSDEVDTADEADAEESVTSEGEPPSKAILGANMATPKRERWVPLSTREIV